MCAVVHARYAFGVVCCHRPMSSDDHNFFFASLQSKHPLTARKVHIRRLYDILQLCIQRQDISRARRTWAILARCKEIQWKSLWITSLLLVGDSLHLVDSNTEKINYLRSLMLQHLDDVRTFVYIIFHCQYSPARSHPYRAHSLSHRKQQIQRSIGRIRAV